MGNDELRELLQRATPGEWAWSENGNILGHMPNGYDEAREVGAIYTERDDDLPPINAELVLAMHAELPRLLADSDELAALKARIAGAPVGVLRDARGFDGDSISDDDLSAELVGQRVALLRLPAGEGE
jgi:hypothetical protein